MISISPILFSRPNKFGKYQIAIRVTKDRKSSRIFIGQTVNKNQWDKKQKKVKKNHPNASRINALIAKKVAETNRIYLDHVNEDKDIHVGELKRKIDKKEIGSSFKLQSTLYLNGLHGAGKHNQYVSENCRVKRFLEFVKKDDIDLKDITVDLLIKYKAWLIGSKKNSERSALNNLVVIRTIYNRAIKNESIKSKFYPFGVSKIQIKFPPTKKVGLSKDEIKKLEALDLPEGSQDLRARDLFLLSYYIGGARVGDILSLQRNDVDLTASRLTYQMNKNKKVLPVILADKAKLILQKYLKLSNDSSPFIFHELLHIESNKETLLIQKAIKNGTAQLNRYLKNVGKLIGLKHPLQFHMARHSFASQAVKSGVNVVTVMSVLRHGSLDVTRQYLNSLLDENIDEAILQTIE